MTNYLLRKGFRRVTVAHRVGTTLLVVLLLTLLVSIIQGVWTLYA
ncbi:MAG TPA: hypothetical protein VM120_19395 [Bryobacteraceae bacterium]|nr:hypothetical protein [Bryobacteraceae bacterium]